MRIIKESFLRVAAKQYPKAAKFLAAWTKIVRSARWNSLEAVRKVYPKADRVRVGSGKTVFVFDVCGNDYRLIVAMHFNRRRVYTLRFLTHAEYSKERWKDEL